MWFQKSAGGSLHLCTQHSLQVIQEFGARLNSTHKQSIARSGTRNIEQLPFGLVDIVEIHLIGNRLDASLQRKNFVVACDHCDRFELEPLGEMHRPDRDLPSWILTT